MQGLPTEIFGGPVRLQSRWDLPGSSQFGLFDKSEVDAVVDKHWAVNEENFPSVMTVFTNRDTKGRVHLTLLLSINLDSTHSHSL